jgi:hypothetical protein
LQHRTWCGTSPEKKESGAGGVPLGDTAVLQAPVEIMRMRLGSGSWVRNDLLPFFMRRFNGIVGGNDLCSQFVGYSTRLSSGRSGGTEWCRANSSRGVRKKRSPIGAQSYRQSAVRCQKFHSSPDFVEPMNHRYETILIILITFIKEELKCTKSGHQCSLSTIIGDESLT